MRIALTTFVCFAMLKLCGSEVETVPVAVEPSAAAPTGAFTMAAEHGGTVLLAEDHWVEVVPKSDGSVEAYVSDTHGEPVPVVGTVVSVRIHGADGEQHAVPLGWNADTYRFEGRLEGTSVAEGPTEVIVIVGGHPRRATAPRLVVVQLPALERPSVVVTRGGRRIERTVVAPAPPPPRPGMIVVAPPPPAHAGVVIVRPEPRVEIHLGDDDRHRGRRRYRHRDYDEDRDEDVDE